MSLVVFSDVEAWTVATLRAALAARSEAYAAGVTVSNRIPGPDEPWPMPFVWVRRDGGPRVDVVREVARLGVNVYAGTEEDATDLANLVRALLWAAPDGDPVCLVAETSGPSPVPDTNPRRYMTFELTARGTDLT